MKLKGSISVLIVAALLALPLKIYQILNAVEDYSTGVLKSGNFTLLALPALLIVSIVLMYSLPLASKVYPEFFPNRKSVPMFILSAAAALGIGYDALTSLLSANSAIDGTTTNATLARDALALVSVVSFIFIAASFISGRSLPENTPLILAPPILWTALRLMISFLASTRRANITEGVYDLVLLSFLLMFFVASGKFYVGVAGTSSKWAFSSGMVAALFGLLISIPRYVLSYVSGNALPSAAGSVVSSGDLSASAELVSRAGIPMDASFKPSLVDLLISLYIIGFLFYISKRVRTAPAHAAAQQRPSQYQQIPQNMRPGQPQGVPQQNRQMPNQQGGYGPNGMPQRAGQRPGYPPQGMRPGMPQGQRPGGMPMMGPNGMPIQRQQMPPMQRQQQLLLAGGGVDNFTAKGAGMRVADEFSLRPVYSSVKKFGGLNDFRDGILSGKHALEVLAGSSLEDNLVGENQQSSAEKITEQNEELEKMTEQVERSLNQAQSQVDNAAGAVNTVEVDAAEDGDTYDDRREEEREEPAAPAPRAIRRGSGMAERFDRDRTRRDSYDPYGRRGRRYYDDDEYDEEESFYGDDESDEYDDEYYDEYDEQYEDEEYDDEYDEEYDEEYEYDEYDEDDDDDYYDEYEEYDEDEYDEDDDDDEYYDDDEEDYYDEY